MTDAHLIMCSGVKAESFSVKVRTETRMSTWHLLFNAALLAIEITQEKEIKDMQSGSREIYLYFPRTRTYTENLRLQ